MMNSIAPMWDGNETWLILGGVAFGFRHRSPGAEFIWHRIFAAGSVPAAFSQGIVLGHFVGGFTFEQVIFEGGP